MSSFARSKCCDKKQKLAEHKLVKILDKLTEYRLHDALVARIPTPEADRTWWRAEQAAGALTSALTKRGCWWTAMVLASIGCLLQVYASPPECLLAVPDAALRWLRPPEDCGMCAGVSEVPRVSNLSRREFESRHAYTGAPVVVVDAMRQWKAVQVFSFEFFARLYRDDTALGRRISACSFFPYKSGFESFSQVWRMEPERANLSAGAAPWYVGWSACRAGEVRALRRHYSRPYFLPNETESDATDWLFMGGPGRGAPLHLDRVRHVSWQAQVRGAKRWRLVPPLECDLECRELEVTVRAGDIVVVDTNRWYHSTEVLPGDMSITIGAEFD